MAQAAAQPETAAPGAPAEDEESPGWGLAPVRTGWNGSVGLTFSAPFGDQASGNTTTFQTTLNGFLDTFIWQPWYIRLNGNAGVSWFSGSSSGGGSAGSADSYSITGAGQVSVFPVSRFPFQAYLERTDSRVSGEILSANFITTRMGALQSYSSEDGTLNLQGNWDRSVLTQRGITDTLDVFQANYRQVIPTPSMTHLLNGQARYNLNDLAIGKFRSYDASLQHNVRPWETLTITSDASYTGSRLQRLSANSYQVGSVGVWYSPEYPLTVTGAGRVAVFTADAATADADVTTVNLNLGANYALNPNVALSGSVNVQTQTDQPTSTFEAIGASYTADPLEWRGWSLFYGGAVNLLNQTGIESTTDLQATGNYSAQRSLGEFLGGQTLFSFGQGLVWNALGRDEGQPYGGLTTTAALGWSRSAGARQTSVNLSLSDARDFGGREDTTSQLINLQANLNEALSPTSAWNGNITVQSSRQETDAGTGQGFVTSLSAAAGYTQGRLFNVPRLLFTTTLFASTVNFERSEGNLDPLTSQYSLTWDNRLFYPIGKTEFELRVQATRSEDQTQGIVFFRVTRLLN